MRDACECEWISSLAFVVCAVCERECVECRVECTSVPWLRGKGGVGKSTFAAQLAYGLAARDKARHSSTRPLHSSHFTVRSSHGFAFTVHVHVHPTPPPTLVHGASNHRVSSLTTAPLAPPPTPHPRSDFTCVHHVCTPRVYASPVTAYSTRANECVDV